MSSFPFTAWARAAALSLGLCGPWTGAMAAKTFSLVAIGNSITEHGPAPDLGWTGHWGMAASSAQSDYVGQLALTLRRETGMAPEVRRFTHVALERTPDAAKASTEMTAAARASDLLVVQLGDNASQQRMAAFGRAYTSLLGSVRPRAGALMCLSTWWASTTTDTQIKAACEQAGGVFVNVADIHRKAGATGSQLEGITDAGVLAHPGDAGMAEMAARIATALRTSPARTRRGTLSDQDPSEPPRK